MDRSASLSVVVPVFNAEGTLRELTERITAVAESLADEWELILVDDGSADRSWEQIIALGTADPRVRGIELTRNFGQHNALLAGILSSRGERVVTLDDDLQNPPEEIGKLLAALGPGADVVYGVPLDRVDPLHRQLGALAFRQAMSLIARSRSGSLSSGFRAFKGELREGLRRHRRRNAAIDPTLRKATSRFAAVGVRHQGRSVGSSNYNLRRLFRLAGTELYQALPLRRGPDPEPSYEIRRETPKPTPAGVVDDSG